MSSEKGSACCEQKVRQKVRRRTSGQGWLPLSHRALTDKPSSIFWRWWAEPANGRQTIGKRKAREGLDAHIVLTFPGSKSPQPPPYPVTMSGLNLSNETLNLSPGPCRGFSNGFKKFSFASVKRPGNWCWRFVPKTLPLTFKLSSPHLCFSRV